MPPARTDRPKRPSNPSLLRRVPELRRHAVICAACALATAALLIVQTEVLARGLSRLVDGDASAVGPLGAALVAIGLVRIVVRWATERSSTVAVGATRRRVVNGVIERVDHLDESGRSELSPARVGALVTSGVDAIEPWVRSYLPAVAFAAVVPPLVGLRILVEDWISAVILAVAVAAIPIFMVLIGQYTDARQRRQWATLQRLGAHFHDVLTGLETLRLFGRAEAQVDGVRHVTEQYRHAVMRTLKVAFLSAAALELLATLSVALVAVTAGVRLSSENMSLSSALVVLLLAPECSLPLRRVGAAFHSSVAGADAAADLDAFDELAVSPDGPHNRVGDGRVVVSGFAASSERGLRSAPVSFTAAPATMTAVVGPSGAGKSTLLAAIAGEVAGSEGSITIGGEAVTTLARRFRRRHIAVVPQRPIPVGDTVIESVLLGLSGLPGLPGRPEVDDAEADEAAALRALAAVDLDALAHRRPEQLSGGERQRLAVARALLAVEHRSRLGTAQVVVVDEPTAHLDDARGELVVAALERLAGLGATVIVATHDQRLVERCDQVAAVASPTHARPWSPTAAQQGAAQQGAAQQGAALQGAAPRATHAVAIALLPEAIRGEAGSNAAQISDADHCETAGADRGETAGAGHGETSGAGHGDTAGVEDAPHGLGGALDDLRWFNQLAPIAPVPRLKARILGVAAEGSTLGLAVAAAWLIFRAAEHPSFADLAVVAVAVRGFGIGKGVFRYGERLASHDAVFRQLGSIRSTVVGRLSELVPAVLGRDRRGEAMTAMVADVDRLGDLELRVIGPAVASWVAVLGAVGAVAVLSGSAALVIGVGVVIAGVVLPAWVLGSSARVGAEIVSTEARLSAGAVHYAEVAGELAAADAAAPTQRRLLELNEGLAAMSARRSRPSDLGAALTSGLGCWIAAGSVAVIGAVGPGDGPTLGVAVLVPFALIDLLSPSINAAEVASGIATSARRLRRILHTENPFPEPGEPAEPDAAPDAVPDASAGAQLALCRASFTWPNTAATIVDLDLTAGAGERVTVTGPSGAGKSTLAAGLVAFLRPSGGRYDLDGVDTTLLRSDRVRSVVTWAQQDPWLASTSIRENLRIARPDASDDELFAALDAVALGGWVRSLPRGLDTEVGIDAVEISGGERQRLSLARVVLSDHRAVVLDEPTAHLDADTADSVLLGVHSALAERTLVTITHDPAAGLSPRSRARTPSARTADPDGSPGRAH